MNLKPISHKVIKVDFKPISKSKNKNNFDLFYDIVLDENNSFAFFVIFHVSISVKDLYQLNLDYETVFWADSSLENNFIASNFAQQNAPAIAFPFLRAFISFMILNAGYEPLVLSSINFTRYKNGRLEDK